jgi:hypothetical protein
MTEDKLLNQIRELLSAAEEVHKYMESKFSDIDFDSNAHLAEINADLHVAIYNSNKLLRNR